MSSFFTKLCKATLLLLLFFPWTADAQLNVNFTVNTTADKKVISPYVYGINATNTPASYQSITTAIRLGGNRMTGYNWENNASHAGHDWNHQNDNYLPWYYNVPSADYNTPGSLLTYLHDLNVANNAYSLITLPMAGYVARDKNGTAVSTGEVAPSARWLKVVNNKGSAFSLAPNTSDGFIYVDEEMNFLINRYGKANTPTGIRGYSLDNEPCLWSSSHPRIHSSKVTVKELLDNSVALSKTIKGMDEYAEVFGPALYGFNAYTTLQQAPDWSVTYNRSNRYTRFVDFYLDSMRIASNASGKRLLDVLDVHWYSDVSGMSGDNTSLTVPKHIERMQITRSLWDSSYVENSWIGTWYSPVAIIPYLNKSIARYYPDTKLAITEYDFGAADYFSGGIAQADALGLFGKYGLYFASRWGSMTGYVKSAFELYRNYDGNNGTFGNVSVYSRTSRNDSSSVYASTPDGNTAELHLIVLNKSYATAISGNFAIQNNRPYTHAEMWYFDKNSNQIVKSNVAINITNNTFTYSIPAASACHFVLKALPTVASFTPASGAVGDTVTITGQNLANVSAITFNNTAVTYFSAISSTQLKVAVPDGATTGLIKITSPAGSGVSASGFTVTTPVVYVSAEGSDSNTGCLSDRPKLTVQAAVNAVDENGTVRIGAGSYNEMVVVGKNMTLLPSGNTSLRSLVMNGAGKTLTIGGELGISGVLRLESGTVASNGNLTLLSTATQTAIIDDFSTGYTGTIMGTITAQRYLPGMQPGYRYLASPVTGATIAQFGSPVNISYYDESRVSGNVSIDAGWVTIETPSTVTSAFTGYSAMMNSGNTTLSLTGTANTGVFTATVTRTVSPATTPNGGYNVLGNPYPSPISWAALWNLNNDASIHKAVYVWNPALNKSAVYNFATGLSANGGTNQVASGQAFRIRRNTQGSSLFTINNTTRRDTLSNSRFLREEPIAKVDELLRLNLSSPGDKTGYETVIHSAAGATEGIDADFDAELIAEPGTAQLYSRTGEAAMMLNALPSLNEERMVLLGVRIAEPGLYTIAATEIAGFSAGSKIYLEDRKLGVTQDLSEKPVYRVSLNQSEADRFVLHFGAAGRTESTIAVQIYSENSDVLVQVSGETAAGRVEVIDLLGHTVATAELTAGQQSARVKVEGADGVYLVRFRHEKGTTVRKVVIIRN